jgi:mannose-1-phosphate guanylyltransferase/phosphomannomutase
MMSAGASIIDLSELPIPVVQYYTREHSMAGSVHIQMSPLDSRSADIRMYDGSGVVLDKKWERKLENAFFREDIRRVHFYEMGDITYARDAIDSYIDGLIRLIDVEALRQAHLKVLVDFDHGSASLVLPRLFKELNIDAIPLNAGYDEVYQSKSDEAFDDARRQSALITRTLGCNLGAYIDYGSERIFLIGERGDLLDHHEALGVLALLVLKAKPGVLVAPASVPQTIAGLTRQIAGSHFVPGKAEPSALLHTAQQHAAVLASDGNGGYAFPEHLLGFDALFTLIKLLELLAKDGRAVSAVLDEVPRAAYEHRLETVPWDAKGRVMRTMVEMHRDAPVDLADGIKVFVDGGWVLVRPDPDMPRYHIIVSMDDVDKARALADRYSALVKTAVGEAGPSGAASDNGAAGAPAATG